MFLIFCVQTETIIDWDMDKGCKYILQQKIQEKQY